MVPLCRIGSVAILPDGEAVCATVQQLGLAVFAPSCPNWSVVQNAPRSGGLCTTAGDDEKPADFQTAGPCVRASPFADVSEVISGAG